MLRVEAAPLSPEQRAAKVMAGAAVQWVMPEMLEQDAGGPQEQKEPRRGELIEPCPGRFEQAPLDAGTVPQEAHQWGY